MQRSAAGASLRWGAVVALSGAALAVTGVFLTWSTLTSLGSLVATVETEVRVAGIRHWSGLLGLAAGGMALLGAGGAGFFDDGAGRRQAGVVAVVAGVLTVAAALAGYAQREGVATAGMPGGREDLAIARDFAGQLNRELDLEIRPPRAEVGTGVYVTGIGGGLAAAGGLLALRREAAHRRGLHFGR